MEFSTIITGIHRAQVAAREKLGIESQLIMCFLRDHTARSAMEHLEESLAWKDWIIGVGLDSDEKDNPPVKFREVFARARQEGYRLTMHCDVNQDDIVDHIRQCLDVIQVDRIDHGINALEDERLCEEIVRRELGLTICPVSNRFVVQSLTSDEIRLMLSKGMKATINSDDPGYFRSYLTDNFLELAREGDFSIQDMQQLNINAFEASWLPADRKALFLERVRSFYRQSTD